MNPHTIVTDANGTVIDPTIPAEPELPLTPPTDDFDLMDRDDSWPDDFDFE